MGHDRLGAVAEDPDVVVGKRPTVELAAELGFAVNLATMVSLGRGNLEMKLTARVVDPFQVPFAGSIARPALILSGLGSATADLGDETTCDRAEEGTWGGGDDEVGEIHPRRIAGPDLPTTARVGGVSRGLRGER